MVMKSNKCILMHLGNIPHSRDPFSVQHLTCHGTEVALDGEPLSIPIMSPTHVHQLASLRSSSATVRLNPLKRNRVHVFVTFPFDDMDTKNENTRSWVILQGTFVQNSFSLLSNRHTLSAADSQPLPMVSESVIASRPQFVVLIIPLIL
jgi:hypothetical protein